jgi:Flp pilus assembly pilin Flp
MITITRYTKGFVRYLRNKSAVSALEYAILVGIIAVALSAALITFSDTITARMTAISTSFVAVGVK